jgi:hypothetical protein
MVLSTKTLEERYGNLEGLAKIKAMIDDMVDTSIIIYEVSAYGNTRYHKGVADQQSRHQYRNHDMGQ